MSTNTAYNPPGTDRDIPIEIIGYVTDPKLVGYQILTNYESTYWRSLVGNDAWGLYEVLRSFCHKGNDTCYPSINLLMDILGITDRRQLTGRVTTTRGKERVLPGLIDTLQDYKLAIAEVKGEGPLLRYVFHVNLTPPPLSTEQLGKLPKRLQQKHEALLERVAADVQKLDKIEHKKPKKRRKKTAETSEYEVSSDVPEAPNIFSEGGGTVPDPSGTLPDPSGTVPPEHYPYNNTKKTTDVVVEKLTEMKIEEDKSRELASAYTREQIEEKIEFLKWKLDRQENDARRPGRPIEDPAGWLIRAIEKDYKAPKGFKTHAQRAEEEEEKVNQIEEQTKAAERQRQQKLAALNDRYGTTQRELDLWQEALDSLQLQMPRATFETWFPRTQLLSLKDNTALIGVPNWQAKDWLENRLSDQIQRTLAGLLDHPVEDISFEIIDQALTAGGH